MLAIRSTALAVVVLVLNAPLGAATASEPTSWVRQFGTTGLDEAKSVAVDPNGASYVVGETFGTLPGQTPAGTLDAFIRKYDPSGTEAVDPPVRRLGSGHRLGRGGRPGRLAPTSSGRPKGPFPANARPADWMPSSASYDPSGGELWTRQFGGGGADVAAGVAVDRRRERVRRRHDVLRTGRGRRRASTPSSAATTQRATRAGPASSERREATTPGTSPSTSRTACWWRAARKAPFPARCRAEGFDAFVASFDTDGRTLWIRQFGSTGDDFGVAVAADAAGNVFVAGSAGETLSGRDLRGRPDRLPPAVRPRRGGVVDGPVRRRRRRRRLGRRRRSAKGRPTWWGRPGGPARPAGRRPHRRLRPPVRPRRERGLDPPVRHARGRLRPGGGRRSGPRPRHRRQHRGARRRSHGNLDAYALRSSAEHQ